MSINQQNGKPQKWRMYHRQSVSRIMVEDSFGPAEVSVSLRVVHCVCLSDRAKDGVRYFAYRHGRWKRVERRQFDHLRYAFEQIERDMPSLTSQHAIFHVDTQGDRPAIVHPALTATQLENGRRLGVH